MTIDVERLEFLPLFPAETEEAIRARWEAWANEGLSVDDVDEWVDTRPGSFWYIATSGGIREAARLYDLIGTELPASAHPLWAWGEYLDDLAEGVDLERLAATFATGEVTFYGDVGTDVFAGTVVGVEGLSEEVAGKEYETTEGGTIEANLGPVAGLAAADAAGGTLAEPQTFYYVVTAYNAEGETAESAEVSDATTATNRTINVSWTAKAGALGYRVYRATVSGGPFEFLAEVLAGTTAYADDGSPGVDATRTSPAEDTTGERLTLPVTSRRTGSDTNAATGAVTVLETPLAAVTIANADRISGGTDPETDEALRERLLAAYEGKGPGTVRDYEAWARAYGGVGRVTVIPTWDGPNTVQVIVLDPEGNPVSAAIVDGLQAFLDPVAGQAHGEAPVGATVTVTTATEVEVDVGATVELEDGYSLDGDTDTIALRSAIENAITDYIESVDPGSEIVRQRVVARIVSIPGVHDVGHTGGSDLLLDGAAANVTLDNDPAQVATVGTITLGVADV